MVCKCTGGNLNEKQIELLRRVIENNQKGIPICSCDIERILYIKGYKQPSFEKPPRPGENKGTITIGVNIEGKEELNSIENILDRIQDNIKKTNKDMRKLFNVGTDYEIWTKGRYIQYRLSGGLWNIKQLYESWDKRRKGYDFVIAIYQESINGYMIYSVPYFNECILNGKDRSVLKEL